MTNQYTVESLVEVTGTWVDSSGNKIDPTVVTISYMTPTNDITVLVYGVDVEVVKEEVGVYSANIFVNEEGRWLYRFAGTGDAVAAKDGELNVLQSRFV